MLTGALPADRPVCEAALADEGAIFVDAEALACEAGSPRSANVVLLGALSAGLPFAEETWREVVIRARVPERRWRRTCTRSSSAGGRTPGGGRTA